jgi:predicted permease
MWTLAQIQQIGQEARHALRGLRRSPTFTSIAVASLALGIGANAAIFSIVNAILLKRLPVSEPERLVTFARVYRGQQSGVVWRLASIDEFAKRDPALNGVFGWFSRPISLSAGETAQWVKGEFITGQYFRTLRVKAAIGRLLNQDDVRNAIGDPVCVLSYAFWQHEFGGDTGVVGRNVFLNGKAYRVLGVTASGFYGAELQQRFDVAVPATRIGDFMPFFGGASGMDRLNAVSWLAPMARLKPGVTRTEAQQQTQLVLREIDPKDQTDLRLEDGSQGFNTMRSEFGQQSLVLMGVVTLVLVVACANLANLLLARAQARAGEFAVRLSLGASRARLIRQLLVETLVLAIGGGIAGVALSNLIANTLVAFLNTGRSVASALHVTPDAHVLVFSVLLIFATAIITGLVPAWQATQPDIVAGLKQPAGSGPPGRALVRRGLVVTQIALSLVIVFGAGLLTRTLRMLATVDLAFQPDRVIALDVDPAANGHSDIEVSNIFDELLKRVRALPSVKAASLTTSTPNGSTMMSMPVEVPGYTPKPIRGDDVASFNFISPDYFRTLGQPLLRGRDFDGRDDQSGPRVAIVNQKFVRHYFGNRDPVGQAFRQGGVDVVIAGIVADARDHGMRKDPVETVYVPWKQGPTSGLTLLVRGQDDAHRIGPSLLNVVGRIDRRIPVVSVHTLEVEMEAGLSRERILGYLSMLFAALATLLAGIGLYGVLDYSIMRRTREIGIRFAVGAQRGDVAAQFAQEALVLVLAGVTIGAPTAIISAQVLRSVLFGVTATDPLTLFISVVVLGLVSLLAMSIPLRRAMRMEPMVALRWE